MTVLRVVRNIGSSWLGVPLRRTARLQIDSGRASRRWERRRSESNRRIEVLQTSALPLGYGARASKVTKTRRFLNPAAPPSVLPRGRVRVDRLHPDARCLPAVARPDARALSA